MTELSAHGWAALIFAVAVFVVFILDRWPIATVCLGILAALPLGFALFPYADAEGPVNPTRFFLGFGNPALVAICSLMVVGQGLVVTGALAPMARRLADLVARHPGAALLAVLMVGMFASGVVNDTPVVVLFIPLLLAAARQAKVSAAGMLLPMNYAVLIGGMSTTIGTSTNLIVVALAASLGLAPIGMFSYYGLVAAAAVPGLLYLWLLAPRLLAGAGVDDEELSEDVFVAELTVREGSPLVGKSLHEARAAADNQVELIDLRRSGRSVARLPSRKLQKDDQLVVRATARRLKELESLWDSALHDMTDEKLAARQSDDENDENDEKDKKDKKKDDERTPVAVVAQLVIPTTSSLAGRSVRQERIAERYGLAILGLRPREELKAWQRSDLSDRRIAAGDVLLVQGREEALRLAQHDGIGLLLDGRFTPPREEHAPLAMVVMAVVVVLAATKALPIALAALLGAVALVLGRCLTWQDVTQSLSTKVILLVAASLALGDALVLTGATAWLAQGLAQAVSDLPPAWVAAVLMALMGAVTNFVSNNAAAAIGTPLSISLAQALGAPPEPFVLAVLFGCNLCYLTPMGYQTNLLVMNAAGYRFGDFLRVGAPLFLIMWIGLSWGLSWRYF